MEDFTVTIRAVPTYGDAWMRRGQARAALGEDEDALVDLQRCLELTEGGWALQGHCMNASKQVPSWNSIAFRIATPAAACCMLAASGSCHQNVCL